MRWPQAKLEDLALPEKGAIKIGPFGSQLKKSELTSSGVHVVGIENVLAQKFDGLGDRYISEQKFKTLRSVEVLPGDVLITMMGTIGKVAIVPEGIARSIMDSHLLRIRPNPKITIPEYVAWLIAGSASTKRAIHGNAHGAIMKGLNSKIVRHLPAPLPPPSEQRRIVEILDQADALRQKRAEADEKASRILRTLFFTSFGDPLTNPRGWDEVNLGSSCDIVTGNTPSTKRQEYYGDHTPWARPADLDNQLLVSETNKRLSEEGRDVARIVPPKSVLVVCIGATLGKVALAGKEMAVNQQINAVFPSEELLPEFLYVQCTLLAERFRTSATKSTLPILNKTRFGQQKVIRPPLEMQLAFSRAANILFTLHEKRSTSCHALERIFHNLMHRAFSGTLTEKWRESHMEELLAEMEEQAKALEKAPSSDAPKKSTTKKRHGGHDMYNKAALAAYITDRCHSEEHPMGRVKLAKLFYLSQKKAEIQLTDMFTKRAAGPLDDQIHKFLNLAKKQGWVELGRAKGDFKPVRPGEDVIKASPQVQKLLAAAKADVDSMLDDMKGWKYTTLERWATVLEAALYLLEERKEISVDGVKSVIFSEKEWTQKLDRAEFSDEHIGATLTGLKKQGFLKEVAT